MTFLGWKRNTTVPKPEPIKCEKHDTEREALWCPLGGAGWVHSECGECTKEKDEAEQLEKAAYMRQVRLERAIQSSKVGARYRECLFENFETTDENADALEAVKRFCEAIKDGKEPASPWLWLHGGVGTGKTHLAVATMKELALAGRVVSYQEGYDLVQRIRNQLYSSENDVKTASDIVYEICGKLDLLIIDDFGVKLEHASSADDQGMLFALFNTFYKEKKALMVITNLQPADLSKFLDKRIADRLRECAETVVFNWQSRRKK